MLTTPGLGEYISGAILFEETLYQSTTDGKKFVDCLKDENIVPGIKVDKVCFDLITFCFWILVTVSNVLTIGFFNRVYLPFLDPTMSHGAKA